MTETTLPRRSAFKALRQVPTRWMDNDHYGHVNNVAYYSFFDTAVNGYLMEAAGMDIRNLPAIGIVAESSCRFFSPVSFPDVIHAGLGIERMGARSVVYAIALFRNDEDEACAMGRFVHVYVDRESRRPVAIPDLIRAVVEQLN
ncbi:MAG: acyl-CoA thioesterase [Acidimicrobiia bacterium]|nr:acyl-CoA thioesterase [Acidimicrobiia bacterium]